MHKEFPNESSFIINVPCQCDGASLTFLSVPLSPVIRAHMFPRRNVAVGQMMSVSLCRSIYLPVICLSVCPRAAGSLTLGRQACGEMGAHTAPINNEKPRQAICMGAETIHTSLFRPAHVFTLGLGLQLSPF